MIRTMARVSDVHHLEGSLAPMHPSSVHTQRKPGAQWACRDNMLGGLRPWTTLQTYRYEAYEAFSIPTE